MFKPKYGKCISCHRTTLIAVKKGLCRACNERDKTAKKTEKKETRLAFLKLKQGRRELIKELDRVFSLFIRNRGAVNGLNQCFTCGKTFPVKQLQCGHYVSRKYYSLRWDETNCQPQCPRCNVLMHGNMPQFTINLQKKYGTSILNNLDVRKNNRFKFEPFVLKTLIANYRAQRVYTGEIQYI